MLCVVLWTSQRADLSRKVSLSLTKHQVKGQMSNDITDGINIEDLRDIKVQEKLIKEYLKDYEANKETLEKVFSLNRKYNTMAEEEEEVARNVNWSLKSFEWDNLFNYGEGNKIDFSKLHGIVGIFGKNYSGKSSIIDGLLYTLFNSTSKNERKNLNVINQNKDSGLESLRFSRTKRFSN